MMSIQNFGAFGTIHTSSESSSPAASPVKVRRGPFGWPLFFSSLLTKRNKIVDKSPSPAPLTLLVG
ncbi:hypothetical protein TIFTF001_027978 [Ficus carica]|uniref:Uncharacterized protein n=1 Tax=Ficus carica TaxID=3494 RepID=A0AA88IZF2_FICCA|nr:hypothetical protein TIFTF001_027978 [Ficus carica]